MNGRYGIGIPQPKLIELTGFTPYGCALAFIDNQVNGRQGFSIDFLLIAPQDFCHLTVGVSDTISPVGEEKHSIRITYRHLSLAADLVNEVGRANRKGSLAPVRRVNSTGIHNVELHSIPLGFGKDPVPGGPGRIIHDGKAFTRQSIKQGAFSDIRPADECNYGFRHYLSFFTEILMLGTERIPLGLSCRCERRSDGHFDRERIDQFHLDIRDQNFDFGFQLMRSFAKVSQIQQDANVCGSQFVQQGQGAGENDIHRRRWI